MKESITPTPVAIFGANLILRHLDGLVIEIPGVKAAEDIEFIHRMRVASRRLRNAIPIFNQVLPTRKTETWGKEIRKITRALGAARDVDVQLESLKKFLTTVRSASHLVPGVRRLILRFEQQRTSLQMDVINALDHFETSRIAEKIHITLDPLAAQYDGTLPAHADLYSLSHRTIHDRLNEFFLREEAIREVQNISELHAQRIAAKHLRYTMELFAPLYSNELRPYLNTCRKFQDQLGAIHDCDVWIVLLPEFQFQEKQRTVEYYGKSDPYNLLIPGILEFKSSRSSMRNTLFFEFINDWDAAISKGLWQQLRSQVSTPLLSPTTFHRPEESISPSPPTPETPGG